MTDKEVIEKIAKEFRQLFFQSREDYRGQQINLTEWSEAEVRNFLAIIKEARYVKLADDQTLPELADKIKYVSGVEGYYYSQQDMLKAGWRKVELEVEDDRPSD